MAEHEGTRPTEGTPPATPTAPATPPTSSTPSQPEKPATPAIAPVKTTPVTQQLGRIIMVAAAVLFGIFAVFNAQHVDFNWIIGGSEVVQQGGKRVSGGVPLILLLGGAFALGLLVGYFGAYRGAKARVTNKISKKMTKG